MYLIRKTALVLGCLLLWGASAPAQTKALNDGFEMQNWSFWTETGNVPNWERFVMLWDVTAPGTFSWAYGQKVYTSSSGGLKQTIFLEAGVTYVVEADFCYSVC